MSSDLSIVFMARPTVLIPQGTPGHAFFCVSLPTNTGPKEECFGFYPRDVSKSFDGPGLISNDFNTNSIERVSVSVRHAISLETRIAVYNELKKWAGADYKILVNNCGDLVFAIAKAAGLRVPDRRLVTLPTEFVEGLKKLYWTGRWASSDENTRFLLEIAEVDVNWTEANASGSKLKKKVSLEMEGDNTKISRENTAEVLQHLGFQPEIIPSILAAGPKPSFMKLHRENARIVGEWSGLVVTKDAQGKFKELRQPGVGPSKRFDFDLLP